MVYELQEGVDLENGEEHKVNDVPLEHPLLQLFGSAFHLEPLHNDAGHNEVHQVDEGEDGPHCNDGLIVVFQVQVEVDYVQAHQNQSD